MKGSEAGTDDKQEVVAESENATAAAPESQQQLEGVSVQVNSSSHLLMKEGGTTDCMQEVLYIMNLDYTVLELHSGNFTSRVEDAYFTIPSLPTYMLSSDQQPNFLIS